MSFTQFLTEPILHQLPDPHGPLLNGILYGEQLSKDGQFYESARRVGLLHIVVISGTNITLMGGIIRSVTLSLGKRTSIILTIVGIVAFVAAVGADPPITRAAVMGSIALCGQLTGRKGNTLYMLLLSAFFLLLAKPEWLTSLSFQLSFVATLGIVLFGIKGESSKSTQAPIVGYFKGEMRTTLAAQAFTVPLIFWTFKEISIISPLANIMVSWAIGPLMVVGLVTSVLMTLNETLALPFTYISFGLLEYIIAVIRVLAQIPYSFLAFNE